jgi:hypothetical protein
VFQCNIIELIYVLFLDIMSCVLVFPYQYFGTICWSHLQGSILTLDGLGLVFYCLVIYYLIVRSCGASMLETFSKGFGDVTLLMVIF